MHSGEDKAEKSNIEAAPLGKNCTEQLSYSSLNSYFDKAKRGEEKRQKYHENYGITSIRNDGFIGFGYLGAYNEAPSQEGKLLETVGLKFHISLPESDKLSFHKGWEIVRDILMSNHVNFKIIRSHNSVADEPDQCGKTITIYSTPDKSSCDWRNIIQEITQKLTDENICPGFRSAGSANKPERFVMGSNYVTYRFHDEAGRLDRLKGSARNEIMDQLDDKRQLKLDYDPISNININVANQPPIPKWQKAEVDIIDYQRDMKL